MQSSHHQQKPKFFLFDAKGKILGRLAVEIAKTLSGKKTVDYQPNKGGRDWAIVINSDKVRLSGAKAGKKLYWRHTGYTGNIKSFTFKEMMEKDSRVIIKQAVRGMLPKNKLSRDALRRLRIFKNEKHPYQDKVIKVN